MTRIDTAPDYYLSDDEQTIVIKVYDRATARFILCALTQKELEDMLYQIKNPAPIFKEHSMEIEE